MLDRILNNNIQPRVGPEETEVEFARVLDRNRPQLELQVMIVSVQGRSDSHQREKFVVKNLVPMDGEYTRQEGDENNILVKERSCR